MFVCEQYFKLIKADHLLFFVNFIMVCFLNMVIRLRGFITGDILEVGAQWAIAKQDIPAFERYMAQLKCYYMDYK